MELAVAALVFVIVYLMVSVLLATSHEASTDGRLRRERFAASVPEPEGDVDITRRRKLPQTSRFKWLYRFDLMCALEDLIWQAGFYIRVADLLMIVAAGAMIGALAAWIGWHDRLTAVVAGLAGAAAPFAYVKLRARRRLSAFVRQLPFALDVIKSSLEAGHSLQRALQVVVKEFGDPLGAEFRMALEQTRIGLPLPRALDEMVKRVPDDELRMMTVAVKVQTDVGSSLAHIVGRLAEIVRTRQQLRLQVRALTAQARMGGTMVALLPVVVLGAFTLLNPNYTHMLFTDPTGLMLLKTAIGFDILAFFIIRRLVRTEF
jgi:tight adherence protein B